MKKKIIGIFVCMLFFSLILPNVSSDHKEISPCYHNNMVYELEFSTQKPSIIEDLPEYFSWKEYFGKDWTTPSKDQGNCGSCWLYAALGALESVIKIKEDCADLPLDLSEQYVLSCLPAAGSCRGGWAYRAFKYIMSNKSSGNLCNGIIPESCFTYRAIDSNGCNFDSCDYEPVECDEKCGNWQDFLIPISDYGSWKPDGSVEDINAIKSQIMDIGPVAAVIMATYYPHGENNFEEWGWQHDDPYDYYPYPGPINGGNHQVVIVGWKDDPAIPNGGYWICKNSFSAEWGYDGFFNIEYNALNIDSQGINWVDYSPNNYSNWIPTSRAGGVYYGNTGQEIIFDASDSFDHEGEISSYHWQFGNGNDSTDKVATYSYEESGIYEITLQVVDNEGNYDEDNTWAFIDETNTPPNKPTLKGQTDIKNETLYEYTFSATDPDGDDIYYYLNWGDTYWAGWWEGWIGPYSSGEEVKLENSWEEKGNYTVRVRAKDRYGEKSDWATLKLKTPKVKSSHKEIIQKINLEHFVNILPIIKLFFRIVVQ